MLFSLFFVENIDGLFVFHCEVKRMSWTFQLICWLLWIVGYNYLITSRILINIFLIFSYRHIQPVVLPFLRLWTTGRTSTAYDGQQATRCCNWSTQTTTVRTTVEGWVVRWSAEPTSRSVTVRGEGTVEVRKDEMGFGLKLIIYFHRIQAEYVPSSNGSGADLGE